MGLQAPDKASTGVPFIGFWTIWEPYRGGEVGVCISQVDCAECHLIDLKTDSPQSGEAKELGAQWQEA